MTSAPKNLLDARALLIEYLGPNARPRAGVTILDPLGDPAWEVGIVGDAAHVGGYHQGSDRVRRVDGVIRDYSVTESSRDRAGLSLYASALDVGKFKVRTPKGVFDLPHYSRWLVAQCAAGTADTRHIREVIYSPDGRTVRRWDRLGKRTTGDDSHLGHTHESYFRDATKSGADVTAVKRRYLTTIGVIEGDDMFGEGDAARLANVERMLNKILKGGLDAGPTGVPENALLFHVRSILNPADPLLASKFPGWKPLSPVGLVQLGVEVTALRATVEGLAEAIRAGGGSVETAAILAGVDRAVNQAVTTITADARDAVADLGEGGSAQVRADT